jgi:GT2 family glycosyltransferase
VEYIVSDDALGAGSENALQDGFPWVRWTCGPGRGPAANRNHAARLARGEWIAFIDDDCVAAPGWVRALLAHASDPSLDVIEGRTTIPQKRDHPFWHGVENLEGGCFWSCNLAFRAATFWRLGGYDEDFLKAGGEDMALAWKIQKACCRTLFVPEAEVRHPQREVGWRGFFARVPQLKWSLLFFQKTGQSPPADASVLSIAWAVLQRHGYRLLRLARDACRPSPEGAYWPGILNACANWLVAPFQLPHLLWWEFAFRRRAARRAPASLV